MHIVTLVDSHINTPVHFLAKVTAPVWWRNWITEEITDFIMVKGVSGTQIEPQVFNSKYCVLFIPIVLSITVISLLEPLFYLLEPLFYLSRICITQYLKAMSQKYFISKCCPILEILGFSLLFVPHFWNGIA